MHPECRDNPLADKLKKDHFGLDQIDRFWRNFLSNEGKGLYATLVEPLAELEANEEPATEEGIEQFRAYVTERATSVEGFAPGGSAKSR